MFFFIMKHFLMFTYHSSPPQKSLWALGLWTGLPGTQQFIHVVTSYCWRNCVLCAPLRFLEARAWFPLEFLQAPIPFAELA